MKSALTVFIALFSCFANADVSTRQRIEVDYLLNYVKNSSCKINRNGKFYEGIDAVSHIERKYDYFRDNISTTEEFIEYSASKSTMSGKYYLVKCDSSEVVKTKEWLLNELKRYRENNDI